MCAKSICGNNVTLTTSYGASKKIKAGTKAHAAHAEPFTIVDLGERIHAPHSQPSLQQESTTSFSAAECFWDVPLLFHLSRKQFKVKFVEIFHITKSYILQSLVCATHFDLLSPHPACRDSLICGTYELYSHNYGARVIRNKSIDFKTG